MMNDDDDDNDDDADNSTNTKAIVPSQQTARASLY